MGEVLQYLGYYNRTFICDLVDSAGLFWLNSGGHWHQVINQEECDE